VSHASAGSHRATGFAEFVVLMASLTALVALSIDMVLPSLPAIGAALGAARPNDNQWVVSLLFLGFGVGQFFYGPFSDTAGRKPAAFLGLIIFTVGCSLALLSQNFTMMLAGRLLQGIGVAGPRTITIALVRDRFEGREMARVMSLVTAVFIVAPIVAPTIGQVLLGFFGWRSIFVVYLAMGLITSVWFGVRQEETLPAARRIPFALPRLASAARQVVTNRVTVGYTVASGFVFGAFLGYLTSAQQILQEEYELGALFTLYFSALAVAIGGASLANARLVLRYGMRRLSHLALWGILVVSVVFLIVARLSSGHPPLMLLMAYLMVSFFGIGLLFGNLTTMAMQPLGAIAGTGSAIVGATSMLISLTLGTAIGQSYNGTVTPLVGGFAILSLCSLVSARFAERGSAPETGAVLVSGADLH